MSITDRSLRVIYITAHGHSGSTLLDLMISAHSQVFSLGEINQIARIARQETVVPEAGRCPCGSDGTMSCPFWKEVDAVVRSQLGYGLEEIELDSPDSARFKKENLTVFEAVATVSGKRVLVDSSKSLRRLLRLSYIKDIDILPVHLIRGPKGQISSMLRKEPEKSLFRHLLTYFSGIIRAFVFLLFKRHTIVRYEDLVAHPEKQLAKIMAMAGEDFEPEQRQWASSKTHTIGGNGGVKFQTDSTLYFDDRWEKHLTPVQKWIVDILSAPVSCLNALKDFVAKYYGWS